MNVTITSDAELDIVEGYWFYEQQAIGLGEYFRDSLIADIDALAFYGGIHAKVGNHHRTLAKRFPFAIYYRFVNDSVTVVAVLDTRRDPAWIRRRLDKHNSP